MFPKNRSVELRCLSADETIQGTGAQTERTAVHQIPRQIVNSMVSKINLITNGHKRTAVLARAAGLSCLVIWNEEEKSCSDDDLIHLLDTRMQIRGTRLFQTTASSWQQGHVPIRNSGGFYQDRYNRASFIFEIVLRINPNTDSSESYYMLVRSRPAIYRVSAASLASHRPLAPTHKWELTRG